MRPLLALTLFFVLTAAAFAERLVFLPIGDRYANRSYRIESLFGTQSFDSMYTFVGFGFGNALYAEVTLESKRPGLRDQGALDLSYNYIPSIPDLSIGISAGIQDVTNQTRGKRSFYVAITGRFNNYEEYNSESPSELTLGAGTGRYDGLFVALRQPITNQLHFLAEYDTVALMAGLEYSLSKELRLRCLVQDQRTFLGASFATRF